MDLARTSLSVNEALEVDNPKSKVEKQLCEDLKTLNTKFTILK